MARRRFYDEWLAHPKSFALLAGQGDKRIGYAVVSIHGPETFE